MNSNKILLLLVGIVCVVGAALCVIMLIQAVRFLEWGRVILYSVCLGVCAEAAALSFSGMKRNKS